ncbi:hypothetical protein DM02DRAFT_64253 [Periconia macrospinosa]|uniref:SAP domain-containing protein n=1 Tax=Periconia macrospinosa TaxID=97972 RepID=A0A2V1DJ22_9PLEO|nr:hypothetical protein DM02DRAFT_64253 [Periconia macrospinosa]
MANYDSQKVPDLKALLTERGLPTTGKKSDLIDRLTKDDEKKAETPSSAPAKIHPEDEIDWDDEEETPAEPAKAAAPSSEKEETTAAAPASEPEVTAKAGGTGQPPNPQAVPNQKADIDPSTTDDLSVKPPTDQTEAAEAESKKEEPAVDFTKGVAASNLDEEIEKRRKRAERFGLKIDEDPNVKLLERAKKFGNSGPPKGLDEALPERERRKRGREDNEDGGRHKRRGGGRSGGRSGRGNQDGGRRSDNRREGGRSNNGAPSWMSEADRQRLSSRKDRFSRQAAS